MQPNISFLLMVTVFKNHASEVIKLVFTCVDCLAHIINLSLPQSLFSHWLHLEETNKPLRLVTSRLVYWNTSSLQLRAPFCVETEPLSWLWTLHLTQEKEKDGIRSGGIKELRKVQQNEGEDQLGEPSNMLLSEAVLWIKESMCLISVTFSSTNYKRLANQPMNRSAISGRLVVPVTSAVIQGDMWESHKHTHSPLNYKPTWKDSLRSWHVCLHMTQTTT